MDVILDAVSRKGCRATIIDLTGVDTVDTGTANHIIRIVRAVQLLGSRGIVVGIRPEVAQTMVSIGVELSAIVTLANLREALLLCMRLDRSM
jgi:anti-anti-sigma regulatory factor